MATIPQPTPKDSRKPVTVRDKWRAKTNYGRRRYTGYAPISMAQVVEVGRLTAGKATQLLYVILAASLGQIVKEDAPFNELACDLRTSELAELCGCDDRTVQRELTDLARRQVITWNQSKKGVNNVTPLFRSWADLADYRPGPVEEPEPEDEPQTDSEQEAKEKTVTQVTSKPVHVAAGKKSKAIPVECGVAAIQFQSGAIDAQWSAVVSGGTLLVTLTQKWDAKSGVSGLLNPKGMQANMRQGCRISPEETREKQVRPGKRTSGENVALKHPRAGELSKLFDPFLLKSCGKSLSGDSQALQAACEAIQDTPHDDLVKAAVERASRPITRPSHVAIICKEIAHNWKAQKDLPPEKRLPTREEVQAMIEDDRKKRLAREKELRRERTA